MSPNTNFDESQYPIISFFYCSTFAGKTAYDLSTNNSLIQCLIEKYLGEMPSKEREHTHSPLEPVEDINFSPKNNLVDTHQPLTANSIKSLENSFEVPASVIESRESGSDSPLRNRHSISNTGIYELIWPEPKCIIELGHVSPPFIVSKELLISVVQVSKE